MLLGKRREFLLSLPSPLAEHCRRAGGRRLVLCIDRQYAFDLSVFGLQSP